MKLKFEPNSDLNLLTKIGFGTWGIGGDAYGRIGKLRAKKLIQYAYEQGIRFFDTAPLYGNGRSEIILGRALKKYPRHTYAIVTKAGLYKSNSVEYRDFSQNFLLQSLNDSLNRLQSEYVDYFLLHSPTKKEIIEGIHDEYSLKIITNHKAIRNFGYSLKSPHDYSVVKNIPQLNAIEFNYSIMDQRANEQSLDLSPQKLLIKIGRTPYNYGFLSNSPPPKSPPQGANYHLSRWSKLQFDKWHNFRRIWLDIAVSNNLKLEELALSFVLSSESIDIVIPGFLKKGHIDSAISTAKRGPLDQSSRQYLEDIYRQNMLKYTVG